ncbi:hypothetical protein DHEL01_v211677 [Diaporthe helianthi]|uniref:DUF7053 domain-containing protein n=1 Tax=Diaporthe helianthi TaxID=158607 RepID=A0A2P5HI45_DIAHE|nr:hypothetical protein DHEL01_v211677 [Diaporthe helianthi]
MSKRSVFTTISPLPADIAREVVVNFLHNHLEMIDLNPLVKERHPIKPPPDAPEDELKCVWYSLTDRISYLPGGLASGDISYTCAFHDIPDGIQTHCRAPLSVDIREKWTLCGTLPGEPPEPVELGIGAPATGLYIREDVDLRCNLLMTGFVKKNLKKSHATLVEHLVEKARRHAATAASSSGGDKDSIRTGQSPSSAADEKPALLPSSSSQASQASQNQQPSGRETPHSQTTTRSPPPQLGSPFVQGYQSGPPPSMLYPSPNTGEQQHHNTSTPATHYRSHSQSTISPSRLDQQQLHHPAAWGHPAPHALPPSRRPQQPHRYSQPPPAAYHHNSTLYPQPLRVRNTSLGSSSAHVTQPLPGVTTTMFNGGGGGGVHASSYRSSGSFSSDSTSAPTAATSSSGGGGADDDDDDDEHPEYPTLNPYSDVDGMGPDDPPAPPRAPLVFAELAGSEGLGRAVKKGEEGWKEEKQRVPRAGEVYRNHPSVLRPGGRSGMGARLDSPFAAELE